MLPPKAPKHQKTLEKHGDTRIDPWFWLRDKEHSETIPYLEAENRYTESVMKNSIPFRKELVKELRKRIKEEDESVPMRDGKYWYYVRYEENRQ